MDPLQLLLTPALEAIVTVAIKAEQQLSQIDTRAYLQSIVSHSCLSVSAQICA